MFEVHFVAVTLSPAYADGREGIASEDVTGRTAAGPARSASESLVATSWQIPERTRRAAGPGWLADHRAEAREVGEADDGEVAVEVELRAWSSGRSVVVQALAAVTVLPDRLAHLSEVREADDRKSLVEVPVAGVPVAVAVAIELISGEGRDGAPPQWLVRSESRCSYRTGRPLRHRPDRPDRRLRGWGSCPRSPR